MKSFQLIIIAAALLLSIFIPTTFTATAAEDGAYPACASEPDEGKKVKEEKKFSDFFLIATFVEAQGPGKFAPEYELHGDLCVAAELTGNGKSAQVLYTPFKKGFQTLQYKVLIDDNGQQREFAILYNGTLSFINGDEWFYVVEFEEERTLFYALYKKQPNLETVKKLFQNILDGKSGPQITTYWPEDSDELLVGKGDGFKLR